MHSTFTTSRRTLGTLALLGCQIGQGRDTVTRERPASPQDVVALPAPRRDGRLSLEAVLLRRRSIRSFTSDSLPTAEIGQLFWAAQGITDRQGLRTAPSAGALYPLECYVATSAGLYQYEPGQHRMMRQATGDLRGALAEAAYLQAAIAEAPAVFVITATYERTARKYGAERAQRYAVLEAGHAAQNVLLQAVALGLGAVPIGAFSDGRVEQLLHLPKGEAPLYLVPVGHPRQ